jgi:hypothetical protein
MNELTLPLMPTLMMGGSILASAISVVVWTFGAFGRIEKRINRIAEDVSFIKGKLESK